MANAMYRLEMRLVNDEGWLDADLLSIQGLWTEQQYLRLTDATNHPIEFTDGMLEIRPSATSRHQDILGFLLIALHAEMEKIGGEVLPATLRVQLRAGKFRTPDLLLLLDREDPRREDRFWSGADLVVEVVNDDDPERDIAVKRGDYAEGRIPEYWIVNPLDETITVLTLNGPTYVEHGVFRRGEQATSALLSGFSVDVTEVFDTD